MTLLPEVETIGVEIKVRGVAASSPRRPSFAARRHALRMYGRCEQGWTKRRRPSLALPARCRITPHKLGRAALVCVTFGLVAVM